MSREPQYVILLYWGIAQTPFPAALEPLLQHDRVDVRLVHSLHEAAAQFALLGPTRVRALLIDPVFLTSRHARDIEMFSQHLGLPLIALPHKHPMPSATTNRCQKVLSWAHAAEWIEQFTSDDVAGQTPDNAPTINGEEKIVTSPLEARYDKFSAQPLLSEQEIRALLGPAEE